MLRSLSLRLHAVEKKFVETEFSSSSEQKPKAHYKTQGSSPLSGPGSAFDFMSTNRHAHAYLPSPRPPPRPPPRVRKTSTKVSRPAPSSNSTSRLKTAPHKINNNPLRNGEEIVMDEDDMGSSFLQYWLVQFVLYGLLVHLVLIGLHSAMCERQIVVPNNSILYCSEKYARESCHPGMHPRLQSYSCRRKDGCQAPASGPYLSLFNPSPTMSNAEDSSDDILSLKARSMCLHQQATDRTLSTRIPHMAHDGKSDLDPSEWKPNLSHRASSEAFQYLSQFHRSSSSLTPTRRPALQTHSTIASAVLTTPSLSHTPTTSTSSDESLAGTPYEFVTRPLLPRHDPAYSVSAGAKSVDLVIPHIPCAFSVPAIETMVPTGPNNMQNTAIIEDANFGKRWVMDSLGTAAGSLKKLLAVGEDGGIRTGM